MKFKTKMIAAVMMIALALFGVNVGAQVTQPAVHPSYSTVSLPFSYIAGSGLANDKSQTTTNLAGGWSNVTSYTNVTQAWNGSNAMVKTTNTVSTTNTLYAEIDGSNQRYVLLQHDFHVSRASYSNEVFTINRSVTGTGFDTNTSNSSIILWTNVLSGDANGTNIVHGTYLLDMAGYARARITQYQLLSTNVLDVLTNDGLFYQVKWDR